MRTKKGIQKLPAPTKTSRVETGAVQFGDDWPGLFIRGDDAIMLAAAMRRVIAGMDKDHSAKVLLAEIFVAIERKVIQKKKPGSGKPSNVID